MNSNIFKLILLSGILSLANGCTDSDQYVLQKYYKDPNSAAVKLMGGLYAGSKKMQSILKKTFITHSHTLGGVLIKV
jgi:hypothetical protein